MTMRSIDMLPALRELPAGEPRERMSFRDMMAGLVSTDRAAFAAEFSSAVSFSLWGLFSRVNVDDKLAAAYKAQYPIEADSQSLHEQWQEMAERGPEAQTGFISGLKGKVAEFDAKDLLEDRGYTNVEIAPSPTQPVWDISATGPDGQNVLIQVKTGAEDYAGEVQDLMVQNPDVHYAVSSEIHAAISEDAPELLERLTDIGSTEQLEGSIQEGLNLLSANEGIDVPDGAAEMIPYAGAIIGGARLIHSALKTEREFKAVDRTTKNRIQVVRTLTLMSRMGVNTVLATAGGMAGASVGSLVPGVGNFVAGIGGMVAGAGMGMYLNKHLQPHMLDLALDITGLTHDDLFYYKNKPRIDAVAVTFQTRARELAAAPG